MSSDNKMKSLLKNFFNHSILFQVSDGAVARPNCYLRQCVCPNGYLLDTVENICLVQDISFPASGNEEHSSITSRKERGGGGGGLGVTENLQIRAVIFE